MTTRRHSIGLLALAACILPDRDIRFESGLDNENAVRIVQRAPAHPQMDALCNPEDPDDQGNPGFCPQVRSTLSSGLVRPNAGDFCICPEGDRRAIEKFEIYAEDADREGDRAKDTIYGVALLDPAPADADPRDAVAYIKYWNPGRAGERLPEDDDELGNRTAPPSGREPAGLTVFPLDNSSNIYIDLCNDAGRALAPGLHTLRFMVTDRPFFRPPAVNSDGEVAEEADGDPAYLGEQWGVPDLAAGATYATVDYVFECRDPSDPEADCLCNEAGE